MLFNLLKHIHQEQYGMLFFAKGHMNVWTSEAGDQTTDLTINDRSFLPMKVQKCFDFFYMKWPTVSQFPLYIAL